MKIIAFLFIILFTGSVSASCDDPVDHVEKRHCSENLYNELVQEVVSTQQLIRDKISAWDQEPEYKSASLVFFDQAAKAFQAYQQEQCEFDASEAAGGNGAGDLRLECKILLYSSYLEHLKNKVSAFK